MRLLFFLILISALQCDAQCYYTFTFEDSTHHSRVFIDTTTDTNNIWQVGQPNKTIFDSAYTYPIAIVTDTLNPYPTNDTSSFIVFIPKWVNLSYELRFQYKLDIDSGDFGRVEYSYDSGTVWHSHDPPFTDIPQHTYSNFSESTNGWRLAAAYGPTGSSGSNDSSSLLIRFTFISDSISSNKDGWMIDDICVDYYLDHVAEVNSSSVFTFSPNPSSGYVQLRSDANLHNAYLQIYGLNGQKVFESNVPPGGNLYLPLPDGIYVLRYRDEQQVATQRIIIQH